SGVPCLGAWDTSKGEVAVTLAGLLDHGLRLTLGEASVAAQVGERVRDLCDAPAQPGDAEILDESMNRPIQAERGLDRLDELTLGNGIRATSDRSARRTSSRASVTL